MIVTLSGSTLTCTLTAEEAKVASWEQGRGITRLSVLFTSALENRIAAMKAEDSQILMEEFNSMSSGDQDDIRAEIHARCEHT